MGIAPHCLISKSGALLMLQQNRLNNCRSFSSVFKDKTSAMCCHPSSQVLNKEVQKKDISVPRDQSNRNISVMERKISNGSTAGRPIRCKAAVCRGAEKPLEIEEVDVAVPGASQVRIKIICTSLCHSDVTFWRMKNFPAIFPRIFGHEAAGFVESVGEDVVDFAAGDFVVPTFLGNCGSCADCESDKSNTCSTGLGGVIPDPNPRFTDLNGEMIYNFLSVSSFTEYTVVDEIHVTKIDPTIPPEKACLLSCGVSTGVGAAWKVGRVEKGSSVAVFGLGAVGLAVAEGARLRGASKIIGVDLNPHKFSLGKKFGLTDFVNPKDTGDKLVSQVIKEMTGGGADYCFECVGLQSVMNEAFESSREGWGKTIILGVEMNRAPLSVNSAMILRGKTICGSLFGGIKAKNDIPILAKQYLDKELRLDEFITHEVGFDEINKAFDLLVRGESLRCIVWLDR